MNYSRWRFSLLNLMAAMTVVALFLAVAVVFPKLATGIAIVLFIFAALYFADRLAAAASSPLGKRIWSFITVFAWMSSAGLFLFFLGLLYRAQSHSMLVDNAASAWLLMLAFLCGAILSSLGAGKAIGRSRRIMARRGTGE